MWNLGKLTDEVKEQALFCIASGKDIERWKKEDKKKAERRKQVLEKLKLKLESPMPKEKKIRKKRILKNKWEIGDMYVMPILGNYPRFPKMKAKYLLLIKIDDCEDLSKHIQPLVYIKYLEEEYYEGMDINALKFSQAYSNGYRFVLSGIAGRPAPKELIYVGNYGDISNLKGPEQPGEIIKKINCNCMFYIKSLEEVCVSAYLMYILHIDGKKIGIGDRMHMTEDDYQQYCKQDEENRIREEVSRNLERKKKEYYICPWKDGDVFYLPMREETEDGRELIKQGIVGIVFIKIGLKEDYATTNRWPIVIMQCVKKQYDDVKDVINDKVFFQQQNYKKQYIMHKKNKKVPDEIKWIGNIEKYSDINILDEVQLPFEWDEIEWFLNKILKV